MGQPRLGLCCAVLVVGAFFLSQSVAQSREPAESEAYGLEPGPLAISFRLLDGQDASRAVTAGNGAAPHPRPLRVYVWYPAKRAAATMRFSRYAELAEHDIWPAEIAGAQSAKLEHREPTTRSSFRPDSFVALLKQPVLATENAKPLDGPYPLIVLGVWLYYESPTMFAALGEYLAGRGFVVASTPLNGTNSPIARVVEADLQTQVLDLEQVVARARELPFVSRDTLGVIGFDMGGMAGLILAMRSVDVDAYASIGSGLLFEHPSGLPRIAHGYDPLALRVPWFHADRAQNAAAPPSSNQESLFAQATRSDRYSLLIENMDHFDFTSDALVAGPDAIVGYWPPSTPARAASSRTVARYVHRFFAAALAQDAASRAILAQVPEDSIPGREVTIEHHAARRPRSHTRNSSQPSSPGAPTRRSGGSGPWPRLNRTISCSSRTTWSGRSFRCSSRGGSAAKRCPSSTSWPSATHRRAPSSFLSKATFSPRSIRRPSRSSRGSSSSTRTPRRLERDSKRCAIVRPLARFGRFYPETRVPKRGAQRTMTRPGYRAARSLARAPRGPQIQELAWHEASTRSFS